MFKSLRRLSAAPLLALLVAAAALAAPPALASEAITIGGVSRQVDSTQLISFDNVTGQRCIAGSSSSCPFGGGGGGGGGSSGAVTGAINSFVDGWNITAGLTTDTACSTDNGACTQMALLKRSLQRITALIAALGTPFQAGASIGNTGFYLLPQSSSSIITVSTVTIGTTAATMDGAQTRRSYIQIHNPSALGGPTFGCTDNGTTPVLYAGGTDTIQPGQYLTYEGSAAPNGPINCIANQASTPITVKVLDQ